VLGAAVDAGMAAASADVAKVMGIEKALDRLGVPSSSGPVARGTDGIKIEYDLSRDPLRLQVCKFETIVPGQPKSGYRLILATTYCEDRLKFHVSDHASMREVRAKDHTAPHAKYADVPVTEKPAPPAGDAMDLDEVEPVDPLHGRWGRACEADWCTRVAAARELCDASRDVLSPVLKCIESVFTNAYLEQPAPGDTDARRLVQALESNYEVAYEKNTDPAKSHHYPWMRYITSAPMADYVMESNDLPRFPDGRRIPFHDMLKVLALRRDAASTRKIYRNNYARLSLYAQQIIDFQPVRDIMDTGETVAQESGEFVSATFRYRMMNTARGYSFGADLDYIEARERMNSIAHPGFAYCAIPRLIAWPPVTYHFIDQTVAGMVKTGIIKRFAPLHDNPDTISREFGIGDATKDGPRRRYPEDDPTLALEYPTHHVVKRIREFEETDRNEGAGIMDHITDVMEIFAMENTVGGLYFGSRAATEARERAREEEATAAAAPPAVALPPDARETPAGDPFVHNINPVLVAFRNREKRAPAVPRGRAAGARAFTMPARSRVTGQKRARPAESESTDREPYSSEVADTLDRLDQGRPKRPRLDHRAPLISEVRSDDDDPDESPSSRPSLDFAQLFTANEFQ
jgi:hypothetical protein